MEHDAGGEHGHRLRAQKLPPGPDVAHCREVGGDAAKVYMVDQIKGQIACHHAFRR
jgi:hypothetical protein